MEKAGIFPAACAGAVVEGSLSAVSSDLAISYEAARLVTKDCAKSFYFCSYGLPPETRARAYAVYAFCRHLDDEVDRAPCREAVPEILKELRAFVDRVFTEGASAPDIKKHPWLPAFEETVEACEIPASCFYDLLIGVEMDQGAVRIQTWADLEKYCYHVAGVVGLMMTRVFALADRKYETQAIQLGLAMQLTNILRDVKEDLEMDRIYLPREELLDFHLDPDDLRAAAKSPFWKEFMKFQIGRARGYYLKSEEGIRQLPDNGSRRTTWLMRYVYSGILEEIEKADYQSFRGRVHVAFPRKLWLAAKALKAK